MKLVECVPNFSEGRNTSRVEAIVATMLAVPEVYLLDREMDHDHNRSVITLAGQPEAVAEAAVRGVGKAVELIDLNQHEGAHPRLGAADVIPFVPLEGTTLEDCVRLANWTGEEIWKRFQVPVYLYESAARAPERKNLEHIRRGQFEGVRDAVRSDAARRPDIGGPDLHLTAGATAVGARKFLIAYNINLETADVAIAKEIAKKIRASSGGLPAVKAMGVELKQKQRAQVSMNLTDFEQTSIYTVWEAVRLECEKRGTRPLESEIVGLIPRKALEQAAAEFLKATVFDPGMVVETRLAAAMMTRAVRHEAQLQDFVEALAAPTSTPGGGTAAAAAGALAAALGQMVAGLSMRKKGLEANRPEFEELRDQFKRLQGEFLRATDRDAEAFAAVRAARRLIPGDSPESKAMRETLLRETTRRAADVPLAVAVWSRQAREHLRRLQQIANPATASDITTALALADAAFEGAAANVEINLADLEAHSASVRRIRSELESLRVMR
jgi:glutamate formiminotransferase